jgi:hypothetical protein
MDAAAQSAQKFKIITPLKKEKESESHRSFSNPLTNHEHRDPAAGVDHAVEEILHRLSPDKSWCLLMRYEVGYASDK